MAKKKAARKKTVKKKTAKRKTSKKVALHKAPEATRARVLRAITRVLAEHGVAGEMAEMHFDLPDEPPDAAGGLCPPGTVRRLICFRDESGTLVCEERCVPV